MLQTQEHRFFQQLSAVFWNRIQFGRIFLEEIFEKNVMLQRLEGLSQQKSRMDFFLFPQILSSTRSSAGFFGWDFFNPWSNNLTLSVSKAPSPAAWAYPAQVPTERGLDL